MDIKFKRGTAAANNTYTGAAGTLSIDQTNWHIRIHDGTTAGGHIAETVDSSKLPLTGGTLTGNLSIVNGTNGMAVVCGSGGAWFAGTADSAFWGKYGLSATFDLANGNVVCPANITAYSDIRLKADIELIPEALAKVCTLRGVTYTRTDSGERQTGVIAQEVREVLPEAVIGDETLSVAYGNMVGLLIEAIKELKAEIDELKGGR